MVCAMAGRIPETMHSAPISRAAATVFIRCWATSESTVGTPVMSRMAYAARWSTMASSRLSITTWLRALSRVPISGTATTPSHSLMTGVATSRSCWRCRAMSSSPALTVVSMITRRSVEVRTVSACVQAVTRASSASSWNSARSSAVTGSRRPATSPAICVGVNPARARAAAIRPSWSLTVKNPGASTSSSRPERDTSARASTTALHASTASSRETVKTVRNRAASAQRWAICSRRCSRKAPSSFAVPGAVSCSATCIVSLPARP